MSPQVAFIADQIAHWSAGTERQMLLLAEGLVDEDWTVPLIVMRGSEASADGRWPGEVTEAGIVSMASPRAWIRAFGLAASLRKQRIRVAHLFFNDTSVLLPPFLRMFGVRVVVARRDMGFWYTPGQLRILRVVRHAVNRVVANSRAVAERICLEERYSPADVEVIYNGLLERHPPAEAGGPTAGGEQVVGLVANIRPVKRIADAITAFASIADRHPRARLRIVGGGDSSDLVDLAENLGVGKRVEFAGRVDDSAAEIARFSVAMLTSESEGFSNAVMEYMQAGKPVVCTDTGGNPELVEEGRTGYLCAVGDIGDMSARLDDLLSNHAQRSAMGAQAVERVAKLCDLESMVRKHASLYVDFGAQDAGEAGIQVVADKS